MTECFQTVVEIPLEKFFEKKNSNIKFEFLCTIVRKVTRIIFVILKNKQKKINQDEFILIIRTSQMHPPATHVTKRDMTLTVKDLAKLQLTYNLVFFLASLIMKTLTTFEYLAFVLFFSATFSALH